MTNSKTALIRGLRLRCPKCGEGRLLQKYLQVRESCPACGEPLGHIRADDGPAWLTILLTGHILAPLILELEKRQSMALLPELALVLSLAIILMTILLPRAKGVFVNMIWASRQKSSAE